MTAPRLADVYASTLTLVPTTWCEMPGGEPCPWAPQPTTRFSPAQARQHALDNPGHYITRESVQRTRFVLDPQRTPGG